MYEEETKLPEEQFNNHIPRILKITNRRKNRPDD